MNLENVVTVKVRQPGWPFAEHVHTSDCPDLSCLSRRLFAHYGTADGVTVPAYCVLEVFPGQATDGTCAHQVLAACPDFEAMLAAYRLLR